MPGVREKRDKEAIKDYALKHSAAHVLAQAVKNLYPHAHLAIGPPLEEGFYYDFGNIKVTEEDLHAIEEEAKRIINEHQTFTYMETTRKEAETLLKGQPYKLELLKELKGKITFYTNGDFVDLCEGPHVKNTKEIGAFKITKLSAAYWRGNEKNDSLTRIYGIAFHTQHELDEHVKRIEEAKQRDHKKIGKELDLFVFSPLVGPGLPLWTPKGTLLKDTLDEFVWGMRQQRGYQKVSIPHLTKKELYETSGHWAKFKNDLFKVTTREGHEFALKPMNCPHHAQIFASRPRSYRDMPQRYCETTIQYRDEQTGELQGLSRVRSITIDDAHVFCAQHHVKDEINSIWDMVDAFYSAFGFTLTIRFSRHDPENREAYIGSEETWKAAETHILDAIKKRKVDYIDGKGEAAFYGPKIDFIAKDSLGRDWQVATIQLDFNQPERFNLTFTNEEGKEERVVMVHAAIAGSFERFISILIEHYAGKFPLWLNPEQVRIMTVNDRNIEHAKKVYEHLKHDNIRVTLDDKSHSIGKKVREAQLSKINYMVTIGDKEQEQNTLAIRTREGQVNFGVTLEAFMNQLQQEIKNKQ